MNSEKTSSNSPVHCRCYTPGPWAVNDDGEIFGSSMHIGHIASADDFPCVDDAEFATVNKMSAANGRLIAACPRMYEALVDAIGRIEKLGGDAKYQKRAIEGV